MNDKNLTEQDKQLIVDLYQSGETLANIKKLTHRSFNTVKNVLSECNIEKRVVVSSKKRFFTQDEKDKILKMCDDNCTMDEICEEVSCCWKVLNKFLKENKIFKHRVKNGRSRLTHEEFLEQLRKITCDIIPLEKYIKRNIPIVFQCKQCGYTWSATPGNILCGTGCPQCNGCMKYTQESFVEKMRCVNDDIEVIGVYNGMRSKITCRCKICDTIWEPYANGVIQGVGCPTCKESYGERQIRKYLTSNHIEFVSQYKFDNCRRIKPLPFDFYLPDYNICIEYDGQQHFQDIEVFGGQDRFVYTQENDKIKTDYCQLNNIGLIRIPFWEINNIDNILSDVITKQNN